MANTSRTLRIRQPGKRTLTGEHTSTAPSGNVRGVPAVATVTVQPPGSGGNNFSSEALFGNHRELHIIHRGECYSLRITSLGRLILTK